MNDFEVSKSYTTLVKISLIIVSAFLVLGLSLPFVSDSNEDNFNGVLLVTLLSTLFWGGVLILSWRILKKLPLIGISVDEEGIWYRHKGKIEGLIYWTQVHQIKERRYMQRLELLDVNQKVLLKVDYQLHRFDVLRDILNEAISVNVSDLKRRHFSKDTLYHWFHFTCIVGFGVLSVYVGSTGNPLLGYLGVGAVVAFCLYEYFITAISLRINSNYLTISYPLASRDIAFSDVDNVLIADEFHNGNRMPEVWIFIKGTRKPYKLKSLGVDSNILFQVLIKTVGLD